MTLSFFHAVVWAFRSLELKIYLLPFIFFLTSFFCCGTWFSPFFILQHCWIFLALFSYCKLHHTNHNLDFSAPVLILLCLSGTNLMIGPTSPLILFSFSCAIFMDVQLYFSNLNESRAHNTSCLFPTFLYASNLSLLLLLYPHRILLISFKRKIEKSHKVFFLLSFPS